MNRYLTSRTNETRLGASQRGLAAVEAAVIMPFLALMLLAIWDFSRVTYDGVVASSAARSAAGYGAQNTTLALDHTGMDDAAIEDAENLPIDALNSEHVDVDSRHFCRCPGSTAEVNCVSSGCSEVPEVYVEVTTTREFNVFSGLFGLPDSVDLGSTAIIRVQ